MVHSIGFERWSNLEGAVGFVSFGCGRLTQESFCMGPLMRKKQLLRLKINGELREVAAFPSRTLLEVLREDLGLTGTKHGCEVGECGTCAVLLDGQPVLSCLLLPAEIEGQEITTIEGLAGGAALHPLQSAFADLGAAQCGYCTPGILLVAKSLLDENPHPNREQIEEALGGNLCRCTGYLKIFEAIEQAAALPVPSVGEPSDGPFKEAREASVPSIGRTVGPTRRDAEEAQRG